jgi:hypothetical protein
LTISSNEDTWSSFTILLKLIFYAFNISGLSFNIVTLVRNNSFLSKNWTSPPRTEL